MALVFLLQSNFYTLFCPQNVDRLHIDAYRRFSWNRAICCCIDYAPAMNRGIVPMKLSTGHVLPAGRIVAISPLYLIPRECM